MSERLEAGALALVASGVLAASFGWPAPLTPGVPGPAFFPRLVAALLLVCALGLLRRKGRPAEPLGRNRILAALGIAGFLLAAPWMSALLALPPLVAGLMWLAGERSPALLAGVSIGFAGAAHLLFAVALGVPLP